MKKLFKVISTVFVVNCLIAGVAVADVRSDLIGMEVIDSVWAIGDHRTTVCAWDKVQNPDFIKEFLAICKKHGQLEVKYQVQDPITGKSTWKWGAIEVKKKKNILGRVRYRYIHPGTGEPTPIFSRKNYALRVKDSFQIIDQLSVTDEHFYTIHGLVIDHSVPQEFDYKIKGIDKNEITSLPPEGNLFGVKQLKKMNWGDWYQYLIALSKNTGGQHTWVIDEAGMLKEANPAAALNYLNYANDAYGMTSKMWYFISEGPQPFTVKRTVTEKVDELKLFHRVSKDLAYVSIADGATVSQPKMQAQTQGQTPVKLTSGIEPKLAMVASMTKNNTTQRANSNDFYEVLYHGDGADGSSVTVKQFFYPEGTNKKQLIGSNDYRVRNNQVYKVETDMIFDSIVPDEVENLIAGVARDSQARGGSTAMYQDYIVVGSPLRDADKCKVEIKIFKGSSFVTSREVDGCNI